MPNKPVENIVIFRDSTGLEVVHFVQTSHSLSDTAKRAYMRGEPWPFAGWLYRLLSVSVGTADADGLITTVVTMQRLRADPDTADCE